MILFCFWWETFWVLWVKWWYGAGHWISLCIASPYAFPRHRLNRPPSVSIPAHNTNIRNIPRHTRKIIPSLELPMRIWHDTPLHHSHSLHCPDRKKALKLNFNYWPTQHGKTIHCEQQLRQHSSLSNSVDMTAESIIAPAWRIHLYRGVGW